MSNRVSIAAMASVVALAGSVEGAGAAPRPAAPIGPTESSYSVELLECTRGKRAADRNALFRGAMHQIAGGSAMRMRFGLSERVGRGGWRGVRAPGLDRWRNARPGVAHFAYRQRIAALAPGTAYRVWVKFQWHDAAGMLIGRKVGRSPICRQGGPLPNVAVGELERRPGPTPETTRYSIWVLNSGGAPAKRVAVSLLVDGAEVDARAMGTVGARGRREISFVGPSCVSQVVVRLDPSNKLRELDKRDNTRTFACGDP